jgi:hypothetical protein
MEQEREYHMNAPFEETAVRKEEGRAYLIDEPELIRFLSFKENETK